MSIPWDVPVREFICSLVDKGATSIVDIGCGDGYNLRELERLVPKAALVGVDRDSVIERTKAAKPVGSRVSFMAGDIERGIPLASESADVVLSTNVMECIVNKDAHVLEIRRIMRPGGQVVCAHYDWDSQVLDGGDKDLVRRIVRSFGDLKQAWMNDCDSWMGRRLWRTFQRSSLFEGSVHAKVLAETRFVPGMYGYETVCCFETLVRRGVVGREEYDRFRKDLEDLDASGEYFYGITMYVYCGRASG